MGYIVDEKAILRDAQRLARKKFEQCYGQVLGFIVLTVFMVPCSALFMMAAYRIPQGAFDCFFPVYAVIYVMCSCLIYVAMLFITSQICKRRVSYNPQGFILSMRRLEDALEIVWSEIRHPFTPKFLKDD
jgi:hypothetical protein